MIGAIVLAAYSGIPGAAICDSGLKYGWASAADERGGFEAPADECSQYLCGLPADYAIGLPYAKASGPSFSCPGLARARGQVRQNENRNQILRFIAENPGSRLYDITKALRMNIGTTRYHLMILSLNRALIPHQAGSSQIRYFPNNGSYTEDHMKIISLVKREPTYRLLDALAGQAGGMTNTSISAVSGLPRSDVTRYLKEMTAKNVVIREPIGKGKFQYRIVPGLEGYVQKAIGRQS